MESMFPVYEMRPPQGVSECLRYDHGKWIPDDGEWDLAFIGRCDEFPTAYSVSLNYQRNILWSWLTTAWWDRVTEHPRGNAWHYALRDGATDWGGDWGYYNHTNRRAGDRAMAKCSGLYGCANGRGPSFELGDKFIAAGLLRTHDTRELVVFPECVTCHRCGEMFAVNEHGKVSQPEPTQ